MAHTDQLRRIQTPARVPDGWIGAVGARPRDPYELGLFVASLELAVGAPVLVAMILRNTSTETVDLGARCDAIFQLFVRDVGGREPVWQYRREGTTTAPCDIRPPYPVAPGQSLRVDLPITIGEAGRYWLGVAEFQRLSPVAEIQIRVR